MELISQTKQHFEITQVWYGLDAYTQFFSEQAVKQSLELSLKGNTAAFGHD